MLDALSSRATRHRRSTGMLLILWLVDRDDVFGWHNRLRGRFLTPSGWPFRPEVTPFTYSFLVYPVFLAAALSSRYPRLRITPLSVKSAWKKTLAAQKREPLHQSLRRNR